MFDSYELDGPLMVVKVKISAETSFELRPRGIVVQVNIFILHGAPEPFNENVRPCQVNCETDLFSGVLAPDLPRE